jgi:hypothetical protein
MPVEINEGMVLVLAGSHHADNGLLVCPREPEILTIAAGSRQFLNMCRFTSSPFPIKFYELFH